MISVDIYKPVHLSNSHSTNQVSLVIKPVCACIMLVKVEVEQPCVLKFHFMC